jgi:hypothetical protein
MTICGRRMVVRQLAMLVAICERCEERAVLQINRQIQRLVLLMVPLVPLGSWYYSQCAACGKKHPLRRAAARELATRARRQASD